MWYLSRGNFMLARRLYLCLLITLLSQCDVAPQPPLKIASHVWPGYELMFLARRESWLPQKNIVLQETLSATESIQALVDGKVDGAALTLDEVLRARAKGIALTIVLVFDVSAGADKVLGKPGIDSLADLAGKRIGAEQSALGALMLHKTLEAAHLKLTDVVPININDHLAAWQNEQVDALISYDPLASTLLEQGATLLFDSRKLPDTIFDVLAVKTDAIQKNPDAIKALVAGHFRALKYFRSHTQDAVYRMAERLQVPGNEALNDFRGLELPNVLENRKFLNATDSVFIQAAQALSTLMEKEHYLPQKDAMDHLVNADFLPQED